MIGRPSKTVIRAELVALGAAAALAAAVAADATWELGLLATLLALSIASDLLAINVAANRVKASGSFLSIVTAAVLLGATPAAVIGLVTIVVGWARDRYPREDLLINLVTYAWFPLLAGIGFHAAMEALALGSSDPGFYLFVLPLFAGAMLIDFTVIAAYSSYVEGSSLQNKFERVLVPVLPTELVSAVLAAGIAYVYVEVGLAALLLLAVVLGVFQYLFGALLLSQERADELELRARQLGGFQVALLSALLRALDLRDRMTARHSAAVARYAREIAAAADMSEDEQELAHTAGLLHDIGKFILPDRILKTSTPLTEEDWDEIRRHPEEGARIVAQIDGYQPVGEIILAHHERIDGLGYPRGLEGEDIPAISRIIAVADTYDVMTGRDSYREPVSSEGAIAELRRVAGTQLDARFVETFVEVLADKNVGYKHGEDADFDAELALDKRIHEYVGLRSNGVPSDWDPSVKRAAPSGAPAPTS